MAPPDGIKRFLRHKATAGALFGVGVLVLIGCAPVAEGDYAVVVIAAASATDEDATTLTSPPGLPEGTGGDDVPNATDVAPADLERSAWDTGTVVDVVDGDTVKVEGFGVIRVIGIDTPERGECGFAEASSVMEDLVLGRTVAIVPGARDDRDRYGRLLRYVDVGDRDAGLELINRGLAIARYDSRDGYGTHTREDTYIAADNNSGDRTQDFCAALPTPQAQPAAGNCDPSYQGVCIPLYPPDLDCGQISERRFVVVGSDPHGFDADHDGIGCES